MSKAILFSDHPKYCELIASGKKTIEVRKTRPKLEPPFKGFIYCTSVKNMPLSEYVQLHRTTGGKIDDWHGKVIGEFVCDRIDEYIYDLFDGADIDDDDLLETCLDRKEINIYAKGETLYGLHITDLKIYDTPKELGEFRTTTFGENDSCDTCENFPTTENGIDYYTARCNHCKKNHEMFIKKLTRAPQSFCYVEEI